MTDEEKACKAICGSIPCKTMCTKWKCYIAGFKAGRETEREYVKNNAFTSMKEQGLFPFGKWHDLKKDPSDLPEPYATVLDEDGNRITYQGGGKWTFYSDYYEMDIEAYSEGNMGDPDYYSEIRIPVVKK